MNRRHIERVVTIANAQKACCLLEGFRSDARNLQDLGARTEADE
jgi:hypothetical protein